MSYKSTIQFGRIALFVVYFWFGILKVFGKSPASPLVEHLFNVTLHKILPFLSIGNFLIFLGLAEVVLGILFLINKWPRTVLTLTIIHLFTTTLPLVIPSLGMWTAPFVPTLEGQYIIKNILILSLAIIVTIGVQRPKLKMPQA